MSAPQPNTHRCPKRGCTVRVPDRLLACAPHWHSLSKPVQDAIYRTARLNPLHPARRDAIQAAWAEWRDL